ncbi:hypothetical protein [Nocardioides sp. SYSU D00038]|uniref:hypothetical protein n=1 Tax=Nocardioides sp. SYSU D00038 TaxID=2812554 RepID=UPI001967D980|nr:hypothetical protein [Nocardioides sp. SYSU D00038]
MTELTVPARFNGPPRSGNGGWTAGALAALVGEGQAVTVRLHRPPPLEVAMPVAEEDGATVATHDGAPVATAGPATVELRRVEPVTAEEARAASEHYPGHAHHPFPTCFVCGTAREPGDGLRIFPGPVADGADGTRAAATWTPTDSQASYAVAWAALDCVSAWGADLTERELVLGTMTARIDELPPVGEEVVVVGGSRGTEGRKTFGAATLYGADGRVLALAEHVWIAIDAKEFS